MNAAAVALVHMEVSFVGYYEGQPLFAEIYQFLYDRGYRFVSLYESGFLTHCYLVGGNALFVHESRAGNCARLGHIADGPCAD